MKNKNTFITFILLFICHHYDIVTALVTHTDQTLKNLFH